MYWIKMMKCLVSMLVFGSMGFGGGVPNVTGYFGLTSKAPLLIDLDDNHTARREIFSPVLTNRDICDIINLPARQRKICRNNEGLGKILVHAIKISVYECLYQFKYERWNCSLGQHRMNLIKQGFKENAFLHAITSAALVYTISRGCSRNILERCTCAQMHDSRKNKEAWLWGGCADNLQYGSRLTDRFLKANRWGRDGRAIMDKHNSKVGTMVVRRSVQKACKCHGISGSCQMKTCWKQMLPFHTIATTVKNKYDKAAKVTLAVNSILQKNSKPNKAQLIKKKKGPKNMQPRKGDLVYIDKSPTFCRKSKYSLGTVGRICDKNSPNCGILCCGRGYNTQQTTFVKACNCTVIWCCDVKCEICEQTQEIQTCK